MYSLEYNITTTFQVGCITSTVLMAMGCVDLINVSVHKAGTRHKTRIQYSFWLLFLLFVGWGDDRCKQLLHHLHHTIDLNLAIENTLV